MQTAQAVDLKERDALLVIDIQSCFLPGGSPGVPGRELGYEVYLLSDGIRAIDVKRGDGEKAVNEMQKRGAILITTEMLMP